VFATLNLISPKCLYGGIFEAKNFTIKQGYFRYFMILTEKQNWIFYKVKKLSFKKSWRLRVGKEVRASVLNLAFGTTEAATLSTPKRNSSVLISVRNRVDPTATQRWQNVTSKLPKDPTRNQIRNLPFCGAVPPINCTTPPPPPPILLSVTIKMEPEYGPRHRSKFGYAGSPHE